MQDLNIDLPEKFLTYANCTSNKRYVAIFYQGSKAVWSDGGSFATFNYYCLYRPLVSNPYMLIELARLSLNQYDFGCDDMEADYFLIVDRSDNYSLHLVDRQEGNELLKDNPVIGDRPDIPPLSDGSVGMFELFLPPSVYLQEFHQELMNYFDSLMTKEWINNLSIDEMNLLSSSNNNL